MKKAVDSATKWLAEKVKGNPKLNPIPYPFFKSIINKQVEWAAKRDVALDFDELAEAVRGELLKAGIYTMADSRASRSGSKSARQETIPLDGTDAEARGAIPPLLIKFHSAGEAVSMTLIFDWLHRVFTKAANEKYSGLRITADGTKEA